jgi:large subunit ribosomal protein L4
MNINVLDISNNSDSSVEFTDSIFDRAYNGSLVKSSCKMHIQQLVAKVQKLKKNRSDVSGGGKKTLETKKAQVVLVQELAVVQFWRSGGVTFAASPRDYSQKVNKKNV